MLRVLGLGAVGVGLAACGATSGTSGSTATTAAATLAEIPDETAGPYPGDGSNGPDVLTESGVVRSDIRSSFGGSSGTAEGVPMQLELTITDLACGKPFSGAAVYVWHCTREGGYSLYSDGIEDQNYLRGVQIADDTARVSFTSIFPACYSGRWPHIHFEVYPDQASITDATNAVGTSQVALPQDVCEQVYAQPGYEASGANLAQVSLTSDSVFGDDGGGEPARHSDRRRDVRLHGRPRRRCRHHHRTDRWATARRRRRRPVRRARRLGWSAAMIPARVAARS
jgi:protocatechuate 3,4-dioxygenase beta subunit